MQGKKMPKYHNFGQIFTFCGVLISIPFHHLGQIWQDTVDPMTHGLCLHAKFHLNLLIVTTRDEKPQFGQMLTFGGLLYPAHLLMRVNLVC